jgi:anti-anti-sigma factor
MEITEEKHEDIAVLGVKGRLDVSSSKLLEERLLAVTGAGTNRIVVDCSELSYISSSGLQVLLLAAIRAKDARGKIVLCSLQDQIKQVLDVAGFSAIFSIYSSRDEALAKID